MEVKDDDERVFRFYCHHDEMVDFSELMDRCDWCIVSHQEFANEHDLRMAQLQYHCTELNRLMQYFNPPNIMGWYNDELDWEVYIRRAGSNEQFEQSEWTNR